VAKGPRDAKDRTPKLTTGKRILTRGLIAGGGRIFHEGKVNVTSASRSNVFSCRSRADAAINFLLRISQQWLTMLFNGLGNPKISHPLWRSGPI